MAPSHPHLQPVQDGGGGCGEGGGGGGGEEEVVSVRTLDKGFDT